MGKEPENVRAAPAELTINIPIDKDDPSQVLKIEFQVNIKMKELTCFLLANLDVFA